MPAIDLREVLIPSVTNLWEFSLSLSFEGIEACPGCGPSHQKVEFYSPEWDDAEECPQRVVVFSVVQLDGVFIGVDHFENGSRNFSISFETKDLVEFFVNGHEKLAQAIHAVKSFSVSKIDSKTEYRSMAFH